MFNRSAVTPPAVPQSAYRRATASRPLTTTLQCVVLNKSIPCLRVCVVDHVYWFTPNSTTIDIELLRAHHQRFIRRACMRHCGYWIHNSMIEI